jgi:RNase P subunit RPR2
MVNGPDDVYVERKGRVERVWQVSVERLGRRRFCSQCEHRYTSDPALLRLILKVRDRAGGGYWWVECGTCECGWQVPYYAESVG